MSIDSGDTSPPAGTRGGRRRRARRRPRVGLALPLLLMAGAFLAFTLPPYMGLDPAQSRVVAPPDVWFFYPVLVTHIVLGSIALVTSCLQIWPWLRRRSPTVHRWVGRAYLFLGVFPAGIGTLVIAPLGHWGAGQQAGNTMLGVLWLLTAWAGYRTGRTRRYAEHREWMVRNVALTWSIVANRAWVVVTMAVYTPGAFTGAPVAEHEAAQAIGVAVWLSWVDNLAVVEWWLQRQRHRPARERAARAAQRPAAPHRQGLSALSLARGPLHPPGAP